MAFDDLNRGWNCIVEQVQTCTAMACQDEIKLIMIEINWFSWLKFGDFNDWNPGIFITETHGLKLVDFHTLQSLHMGMITIEHSTGDHRSAAPDFKALGAMVFDQVINIHIQIVQHNCDLSIRLSSDQVTSTGNVSTDCRTMIYWSINHQAIRWQKGLAFLEKAGMKPVGLQTDVPR